MGYFMGHFTGLYILGRTISFLAICLQIALGARLAQLETAFSSGQSQHTLSIILVFGSILIIVAFNSNNLAVLSTAIKGIQGLKHTEKDYNTLVDYIGQYDVVLSDLETSWKMPAYGGKIIASKHPISFIDDHAVRRNDLKTFFSNEATYEKRNSIVQKYKVDYILLDKDNSNNVEQFYSFGHLVYENLNFLLIKTQSENDRDMP